MIKFSQISQSLEVKNPHDFIVSDICLDSRKVSENSIFAAVKGAKLNGEDFIPAAIASGAKAIIVSDNFDKPLDNSVSYIFSNDISKTLADLCQQFYTPKPENIIAVTGTNGKTSVANFCAKIIYKLGQKSAALGTLGLCLNGEYPDAAEASLTTPDIITLHKTLQKLKSQNTDHVAFEASSHGLDQGRLLGVDVKVAGFTNLTQDHLDYHKTMDDYFAAKLKLFSEVLQENGIAVVNSDSEYFAEIMQVCMQRKIKLISYGKKSNDIRLVKFTSEPTGQQIEILFNNKEYNLKTNLIGNFQSYNLLCAIGMIYALGFDFDKVIDAAQGINSVRGRMEVVGEKNAASIIVDYAHTPDALEKAITAIRPHTSNRLITLFGCGGDRDQTKRPLMGKIASANSDIVIVTDDNPRTEDAAVIRSQIISAAPNATEIAGRKKAISHGINMLQPGDILLLAGKGHEDYQIIGTTKNHFNEVEIVQEILGKR